MFNLYDYIGYWGSFDFYTPQPRALTANQLRVKRIKAKARALKMQKTKKGKR